MKLNPAVKLSDILKLVEGKLIGDADFLVQGINEIHKIEVGDITFVDHPKYYKKVLASAASVVIIDQEV